MISAARRKALLGVAQRMTTGLLAFRTPESAAPVAPSFLGPVIRFLQAQPSFDDLASFLKLMPGSYLKEVSRGAQPQVAEVARQVAQAQKGVQTVEELLFVLGWTRRLLTTREGRIDDGAGQRPAGPTGPAGGRFSQGSRGGGGASR